MEFNNMMYLLMAGLGVYLIFVANNLTTGKFTQNDSQYELNGLSRLYRYMGITFIIMSVLSFIVRMTYPQYEVILPILMLIAIVVLNLKFRKKVKK